MVKIRAKLQEQRERRKNQKGFTLVELMATLGILALILAIAVPAVGGIMANAEKNANDASVAMIEHSAQIAYAANEKFSEDESFTEGAEGYTIQGLVDGGFLDVNKLISEDKDLDNGDVKRTDEVHHDAETNSFDYQGDLGK